MRKIIELLFLFFYIISEAQITPTIQATDIIYSNISYNTFTVSCVKGNGTKRAIFIKKSKAGRSSPVNDSTYIANQNYGLGSQIETSGWFCVYNGSENSITITNLSPNTNYIIHICEYNGNSGSEKYLKSTNTNNPLYNKTYNYTEWDGKKWSNGSPSSTSYTIINGNYSGISLTTKELIINSPYTLNIIAGKTLTTNGKVIINGKLIIESNGILDGSFINYDSVFGNITMKKYITPNQWHLISSPVKNYPADSIAKYYNKTYNESLDKFNTTYIKTGILSTNVGYAIWSRINPVTISYTGNINYQSSVNLTRLNQGYNLIGNPYTSCLDWESSYWNKTNISNTIWIWNGIQYASYTSGIGGINGGDRYISPGQGFFVQTLIHNNLFTIDNRTRIHNTTSLLKSTINTSYNNLIIINTSNGYYNDQSIVAFRDSASNDSDKYDAKKLLGSSSYHQCYFENNNRKLCVNVLKDADSIPFIIKSPYNSNILISFENYTDKIVLLYDNGKEVWLNNNTYNTTVTTTDSNRFHIKLKNIPIIDINTTIIKPINIKNFSQKPSININKNSIFIDNLDDKSLIQLFDLNGIIYINSLPPSNYFIIDNLNSNTYILRIISNNYLENKIIKIF